MAVTKMFAIVLPKITALQYLSREMLLDLVTSQYKVGSVTQNMNGSLMRPLISAKILWDVMSPTSTVGSPDVVLRSRAVGPRHLAGQSAPDCERSVFVPPHVCKWSQLSVIRFFPGCV